MARASDAAVPPSPAKSSTRRSKVSAGPTFFQRMWEYVDRTDPLIRSRQDLGAHVALFAAACWALHAYGHKLAV